MCDYFVIMLLTCRRVGSRDPTQQQLRAPLRRENERYWSGHRITGTRCLSNCCWRNLGGDYQASVAMATTWRILLPFPIELLCSAERSQATSGSQYSKGPAVSDYETLGLIEVMWCEIVRKQSV